MRRFFADPIPLRITAHEGVLEGKYTARPYRQGVLTSNNGAYGEEIDDEIVPHHQGAQFKPSIPLDYDAGAMVTTKNPGHDDWNTVVHFTSHGVHPSCPGPGRSPSGHGLGLGLRHGLTIIKRIRLKAKEGFDNLTTK